MFKNRPIYLIVRRSRYKLRQHLRYSVIIPTRSLILIPDKNNLKKFPFFVCAVMMKKKTLVCQFASPLDVDVHSKPEVINFIYNQLENEMMILEFIQRCIGCSS